MARDPKRLRKAYEFKLGKDLVGKLSDAQIGILSSYYNSLSESEQSDIDNKIAQGRTNELREMAEGMISEQEISDPVQETQDKLDKELKGKSDEILSKIDELIEDYKQKVKDGPDGGKKSGALAVISKPSEPKSTYEEVPNEELMGDEEIDPEVLESLGLEDATDLTYDEYKTLLKEKLVANRQTDAKDVSSETDEKLREELKRVKTQKGKFKVKSTGAKMASSFVRPSARSGNPRSSPKATQLLSGVEEEKEKDEKVDKFVTNQLPKSLEDVVEGMNAINAMLMSMLAFDKAQAEIERQAANKAERSKEEQESEKDVKKSALGALKSVIPKMGFLDMLKKYFGNILAGGALLGLMKWLKDPDNQEKLRQVSDFIVDNLPLIGAGILGFLSLGIGAKLLKFITMLTGVAGKIGGALLGLGKKLIGGAASAAGKVPGLGAAGIATALAFLVTGSSRRTPGQEEQALINQYAFENDEEKLEYDRYLTKSVTGDTEYKRASEMLDANPDDPDAKKKFEEVKDRLMGEYALQYFEDNPELMKRVALRADERLLDVLPFTDKAKEEIKKLRANFKESQSEGDKNRKIELDLMDKKLRSLLDPMTMQVKPENQEEYDKILALREEALQDYKSRTSEAYTQMSSGYDDLKAGFLPGQRPAAGTNPDPSVEPQTPLLPAQNLGRQGTTSNQSYGPGGGDGKKGFIIVPGHAAGGGAPHEAALTRKLSQNVVDNLRARFGDDIPIKVMDMHDGTADTQEGFIKQMNRLKQLEKEGYEVIELHMDASLESGDGTGRGMILPMPGTDEINSVEADFARTSGAFPREHRGGLAATDRGIGMVELGNMSPELQQATKEGRVTKGDLDNLTRPLEESLMRGLNLKRGTDAPETAPMTPAQLSDDQDLKGAPPPPVLPPPPNLSALPTSMGGSQPTSSTQAGQKIASVFGSRDPMDETSSAVEEVYNIMAT